ncbi:hypothetical protein D3C73_1425330 [compost metagenome]
MFAVHRGGRAEDKLMDSRLAHRLQQHQGTGHVILIVLQRFLGGLPHRLQADKVDHRGNVVFLKDTLQATGILYISPIKRRGPARQLLHAAQRLFGRVDQIIQHHHIFTTFQQSQHRM